MKTFSLSYYRALRLQVVFSILLGSTTTVLWCWLVAAAEPCYATGGTYSSASVWRPVENQAAWSAWQGCNGLDCVLAYMKKSGAGIESMNFVRKLNGEGYLAAFKETGHVDLGRVEFPTLANTNGAFVLLNGSPLFVSTELKYNELDISRDPNYSRLKKEYTELELWPAGADFISVHTRSSGGQRFIFSYYLVNGCHACAVPWNARVAFDFGKNGKFQGTKVLKLIPRKR